MNRQDFDELAEKKQYVYHRRHFAAVRSIENSFRIAEKNIIRDLSKYMPPSVVDPETWLKLNAGPDALANLRRKAMELPEPQRSAWLARLDKPSWRAQISNKNALYKRIDMEGLTAQRTINDTLNKTLRGVAAEGYTRQMFEVQKDVDVGWSFDLPNTQQADAMVRRVMKPKYVENLTRGLSDNIKQTITAGILSGKSMEGIAKDVQELTGDEVWKAKRLVRTESTAAAAEGELEALNDKGIEYYTFRCGMDEKTCPVCGALDRQDFRVEDAEAGVNFPHMHPNCRCWIQRKMSEEKKKNLVQSGKVRDPETGKWKSQNLPPGMTYEQWKERYAKAGTADRDSIKPKAEGTTNHTQENVVWSEPYLESPFGDATTPEELAKIAKEKYGIDLINPERADFKMMQSSLNNMSRFIDENPKFGENIKIIRVTSEERHIGPDDFANTGTILKDYKDETKRVIDINLNEKWYKDARAIQKEIDGNSDWFVKGATPDNLIVHEFGHASNYTVTLGREGLDIYEGQDVFKTYIEDATKIVNDALRKDPSMNQLFVTDLSKFETFKAETIKKDISEYALENDRETIAEAFNDVFVKREKASNLSKEIYKSLKDILDSL
ncbi:MAG: minor capsid protein [Candidatus Methanoplasma sp.]|jgi:SPP1 gp7 family putative phage head morphogenesis protein|nr:minor capsid protein [Candidatus Methanoplasma sp.]